MRKTYAAEADRVLCQLVMFLTVFFLWMYQKKAAAIKSRLLFMASLFIVFFWLRDASLVKVGNPISDGMVFVFHLA